MSPLVVAAALLGLAHDDTGQTILLQPLGKVSSHQVTVAKLGVEKMFDARVLVQVSRPLPRASYYSPRNRYRAELILNYLAKIDGGKRVLGLTEMDISTTNGKVKDWGVIGLGQLGGPACVVSTYRLGRSGAVFDARLKNAANHELGHTFGLNHCPRADCVMHDYRGRLAPADNRRMSFCKSCSDRLKAVLRSS